MSDPLILNSPADVVAAIPYLLTYHPDEDLVVLGHTPRGTFTLRLPLADPLLPREAERTIRRVAAVNRADWLILMAFTADRNVEDVLLALHQALSPEIRIKDVLRVHGNRIWPLLCRNTGCCPPDGLTYDPTNGTVPATAIMNGLVAFSSRAEIASRLAPVESEHAERMQAETERAEAELLHLPSHELVERGLDLVRALPREGQISDRQAALLSVALAHPHVRDEAWIRIANSGGHQHVTVWSDLSRRTVRRYRAAPTALLTFAAHITGEGVLASIALDHCLEIDPTYNLALILRQFMTNGVPADLMRKAAQMTSEELAARYAEQP